MEAAEPGELPFGELAGPRLNDCDGGIPIRVAGEVGEEFAVAEGLGCFLAEGFGEGLKLLLGP